MSPVAVHAQEQLSVKLFTPPISVAGPSNLLKPDNNKKRAASSEPDEHPDPKRIKDKEREKTLVDDENKDDESDVEGHA
ncbi:hypothetical protein B0H15DRAFT_943244 [Mycena belliarum]|uniref:Uncharacterized protein n=1 Tax=Mycena belliarum TaxID=1033014 RepID=A0AAD6XTK6_9AGAR|nr:hypothetical protein B0H15DRAFT_943244 [Mycena belliae]